MFCLTLVQCSLLLCLSWTILSTKMHLHMFPLLKMLCETMKFFHHLKMRKNVVSLLLPNDRRLAVPGSRGGYNSDDITGVGVGGGGALSREAVMTE